MRRDNLLEIPPIGTESPAFQMESTAAYKLYCGQSHTSGFPTSTTPKPRRVHISSEWIKSVPTLLERFATVIAERKQQEMRALVGDLEKRIHRLESMQTLIVTIDTFAPAAYTLLMPFHVSVQSVHDGFEASWFDANIHTSGETEEMAVQNLKSLILDYFEIFSSEPLKNLGIEPSRQLAILNQFVKKGL